MAGEARDAFAEPDSGPTAPSWAMKLGGSGGETGNSIHVDAVGNISGRFAGGAASFGTNSVTPVGGYDVFVAKVNPNGQI